VTLLTFLVGVPSVLSEGAVSWLSAAPEVPVEGVKYFSFLGQSSFLGLMDFIWGNISLALGALLLSVFVGWIWGRRGPEAELRSGADGLDPVHVHLWWFFLKYVCPVVIFAILLNVFGVFGDAGGG
jgi:NSS family neurotransmitter:Na+ symporter